MKTSFAWGEEGTLFRGDRGIPVFPSSKDICLVHMQAKTLMADMIQFITGNFEVSNFCFTITIIQQKFFFSSTTIITSGFLLDISTEKLPTVLGGKKGSQVTCHYNHDTNVMLYLSIYRYYWANEASPTLGCSIEISRDICMYVCMSSNVYGKTIQKNCMLNAWAELRNPNTCMFKNHFFWILKRSADYNFRLEFLTLEQL